MWKSDIADDATGKVTFRAREAIAAPQPTLRVPPGGLKADHYVTYARQVWHRDRELAARHLYQALRLEPDHAGGNHLLAAYFFDAGLVPEALLHSERAAASAPDDVEIAADYALVLDAQGRTDAAMALIRRHLAAGRVTPALILRFAGVAAKAKCELESLDLICRALPSPSLAPGQRRALHFHAAHLLDRMGRYDEAFDHARRGHAAAAVSYDPRAFRAMVRQLIAWCTRERLRALPAASHGWSQPVFIVGMPSSGTTLVEQILDSHPEVFGGGELLDLSRVVGRAIAIGGGDYVSCFARASQTHWDALAGLYLSRVASFAPAARYITDKLPPNWMHLGLISRIFPQARVIHVVRDPLDTCLSCYMTNFSTPLPCAADLTHLAMHYDDQRTLMNHWRDVLDLSVLEVSYEALVSDSESQVRRMLAFLELPWDPACLAFHENTRVAGTASIDQVRRPMYRSSVGRWKNYERHLGPLATALGLQSIPSTGAPRCVE